MLFNSLPFLFVFLPITMLGFHLLGRYGRRPVIAWLAVMSVLFYARWNAVYVGFLLGSILVNYVVAVAIGAEPEHSARRKHLLTFGVILNLLALFYFKYLYKVLLTVKALHLVNLDPHPILLPLGISFFTFTQISYLVDLAQGQAEIQDFLSYLLFVTFFPHLIAGPILHHKEMMPQFGRTPPDPSIRTIQTIAGNSDENADLAVTSPPPTRRFALKPEDVSLGITWFLMGLAKKVLIADKLASTADITFHNAGSLSAVTAWTGLIVYSMQLYFDFSGYSDMALGLARIFSIRFPLNFDSPYKATSVTEYWQRWHMTLTRYITLYLYNPILLSVQRQRLEKGRKTSRKALATFGGFTAMVAYPTLFTMLLTGIWHGAGLQFIVFGLIHGVYLTANQAWRHFRQRVHNAPPTPKPAGLTRLAMMLGVYLQVTFALIFFRSESMATAIALIHDMFGRNSAGHPEDFLAGVLAFALFPIIWFFPNTQQILGQQGLGQHPGSAGVSTSPTAPGVNPPPAPTLFPGFRWRPNLSWAVIMAVLFFAVLANLDSTTSFLYFQF
jgi:alginate O-acetyltransferase complex protein AlgI